MKLSITTFTLICLFSVADASPFTEGASAGFIGGIIGHSLPSKSNKISDIKYYNRDTSLQKFPPVYNPQCIIEKNIIVSPPLTLSENIIISIIFMLVVYSMIHISCCSDEETRGWTRGYIFGRLMEMLCSIIIDILIGDKD